MSEILLDENQNRNNLLPIQYNDIWEHYMRHLNSFWIRNEIDLSKDRKQFEKLDENQQYFIKCIIAFFFISDKLVSDNIGDNFAQEVQIPEAKYFYDLQKVIENIHNETYSALAEEYITDPKERELIISNIENFECVKGKLKWMKQWMDESLPFQKRLLAFIFVEGVFFSGAFCAIYWIAEKAMVDGKSLDGLCKSNEFIARDEGYHCEFGILLYNRYIKNKLTEEQVHELARQAVEIEIEFIKHSLPVRLLGMDAIKMEQYIKFVANRILRELNYKPLFGNVTNPFVFMEKLNMENKTNFFEQRVSEYKKAQIQENEELFCEDF